MGIGLCSALALGMGVIFYILISQDILWVGLSVERIRQVRKFRVGLNVVECMSG